MLTLRGVDYGSTFCAVGARGFAGEGYPFHKLWSFLGMTWEGTAFAGKTMTRRMRNGQLDVYGQPLGNMILKDDGMTPKELFPHCIWGSLMHGGEMVNQVGLSNFGVEFYLDRGVFNGFKRPFMISIMLMEQKIEARKRELFEILWLLRDRMPTWVTYALQINFACPNTGHDNALFYQEMPWIVKTAKEILVDVPIVANVNALMPTDLLVAVAEHADALWVGNAIPVGNTESDIDWSRHFEGDAKGRVVSPLARRNPNWVGGFSSPACLPLTHLKVRLLRASGVKIPIVAGNGIRTKADVLRTKENGADAIFIGSLGTVRPWRMRSIIKYSNQVFSTKR